ncbi:hypothetical protein IF2G_11001 [Cordyceps javanica]|nr:hypothetical protein IF2G_11001 [Cordyceps javanica]
MMAKKRKRGVTKGVSEVDPLSLIFGAESPCPQPLRQFIETNLASTEICSIWSQLQTSCAPDHQVLWTGMPRERAQKWADSHGMQTLTTAMGEYMNPRSQLCPQKKKTHAAWISYIHGASALFAIRISQGELVTLLSNPPPQRFHPKGNTSFQCIEGPIVTGVLGNRAVTRIEIVHPTVAAAYDFEYQIWPEDHAHTWLNIYGASHSQVHWRQVKQRASLQSLRPATANQGKFYEMLTPPPPSTPSRLATTTAVQKQPLLISALHGTAEHWKYKKDLAGFEASLLAKMRAFNKSRKADRKRLRRRHTLAIMGPQAHVAKRAAHQGYDLIREEMQNTELQQLKKRQQKARATRRAIRGRLQRAQLHKTGKNDAVVADVEGPSSFSGTLSRVSLFFRLTFHTASDVVMRWICRRD